MGESHFQLWSSYYRYGYDDDDTSESDINVGNCRAKLYNKSEILDRYLPTGINRPFFFVTFKTALSTCEAYKWYELNIIYLKIYYKFVPAVYVLILVPYRSSSLFTRFYVSFLAEYKILTTSLKNTYLRNFIL